MAILNFQTAGELKDILNTRPNALIFGELFTKVPQPVEGTVIYTDEACTQPADPLRLWGMYIDGQLYELLLGAGSEIIQKTLVNGSVNPSIDQNLFLPAKDALHNSSGVETSVRSQLSLNASVVLSDAQWATLFGTGTRRVFLSAELAATAAARSLSALNVADMEGFDLAPLIHYDGNRKYSQTYVHIKENPAKNRRISREGDYTYFWYPEQGQFRNDWYPDFYKDFPDFDLSDLGIISTHQYIFEDDLNQYRIDKKGYTHSITKPYAQRHIIDYERWALDLGMPAAYTGTIEARKAKLDSIPQAQINAAFKSAVVDAHKNAGIVELNFEVFNGDLPGGGKLIDDAKVVNTIAQWKQANPTALLSFWYGGFGVWSSRPLMQSAANSANFKNDLKFTGTYQQWMNQRSPTSLFYPASIVARDYADLLYVTNGYQADPTDHGYLHHAMMNTVMNRKFFPDKKLIWLSRHCIEYQVSGAVDELQIVNPGRNNELIQYSSRPLCSPGLMWSWSLLAHWFADGEEQWESPLVIQADPHFFGPSGVPNQDANGNAFTADRYKFYDNQSQPGWFFPDARPMKGLNRSAAARWTVHQNRDIRAANTNWQFLEFSLDGGSTYKTGDDTLLSETLVNRQPIVIGKPSQNGNEMMVIFANPYQNPATMGSYKIKIGGVVKAVRQYGDYASCVRIKI